MTISFTTLDAEAGGNGHEAYVVLFGIQIILLTFKAISFFSTSQSLGVLVRAIILMATPIIRMVFIFAISMLGFLFGLWAMMGINQCAYQQPSADGEFVTTAAPDDDCEDFELMPISRGLVYVFQVFIGAGDLSGTGQTIDEEPYGVIIMIVATIFGAIILTNLLIALMNNEYENVMEQAASEVAFRKAQLAYQLSKQGRLMPFPLNILVILITFIVDIITFTLAIIRPKDWNIYEWINHQLFVNLQNLNIWQCEIDNYKPIPGNNLFRSPADVLKFYFLGWYYDWIKQVDVENEEDIKNYWRFHHKACYGVWELNTNKREDGIYKGVTISNYFDKYETKRRQKLQLKSRQLLKQLTKNTLFCEHCYRPFLKERCQQELTTSYIAMLDLISAIVFVVVPIIWFPLILLFFCFWAKDKIFGAGLSNNLNTKRPYTQSDCASEV